MTADSRSCPEVWIVTQGDWEDSYVAGVYGTEASANEARQANQDAELAKHEADHNYVQYGFSVSGPWPVDKGK